MFIRNENITVQFFCVPSKVLLPTQLRDVVALKTKDEKSIVVVDTSTWLLKNVIFLFVCGFFFSPVHRCKK